MRKSLTVRSTNGLCPFIWELLELNMQSDECLKILLQKGYKITRPDVVAIARGRIGVSKYKHAQDPAAAPGLVDCATFVRWVYSHLGIWLPRFSIQQSELGWPIELGNHKIGDLIFSQGYYGKYWVEGSDKIGHVGLVSSSNTVIHAAGTRLGVIESTLEYFCEAKKKFRGIRRICNISQTPILKVRPGRLVETVDDLRWDILNTFGRG